MHPGICEHRRIAEGLDDLRDQEQSAVVRGEDLLLSGLLAALPAWHHPGFVWKLREGESRILDSPRGELEPTSPGYR